MDSGKEITADGIKDIKRVQPKKTTNTRGKEHNLFANPLDMHEGIIRKIGSAIYDTLVTI